MAHALSEEVRASCSSGGIFGVLAEKMLGDGGVVFGAAYIPEEKKVEHVSTQAVSLERLKRSKYVQSDTGNTFSQVRDLCCRNISVLYAGTPCQISGLKAYLGKEYDCLLTMDFVCHGVPSPEFFRDTIASYERNAGSHVVDFTFREKLLGWRTQAVKVCFQNGNCTVEKATSWLYYYLFLRTYTLRRSCFSCKRFKAHVSDLTVADHWRVDKSKDDDRGISLININTDAGAAALNKIRSMLSLEPYEERNLQFYSHEGYDLNARDRFFDYYIANGADKTINKYTPIMHRQRVRKKITRIVSPLLRAPHALWRRLRKRTAAK